MKEGQFNVLLLTIDCLRYDRCGINGYHRNTTPQIDQLGAESVVFDRAYSTGSWTPESFPGILAGLHSHNSSYYTTPNLKAIPPKQKTIASEISEHGYDTFAKISNPHLTEDRNYDIGFDHFTNIRDEQSSKEFRESKESSGILDNVGGSLWELKEKMQSRSTLPKYSLSSLGFSAYRYYQKKSGWPTIKGEDVVDELIDSISTAENPFFGWGHFMDLHAPLNPNTVTEGGLFSGSYFDQFSHDAKRASNIFSPGYEAMYDSALRYVDAQVSRLIEELKQQGVWENTVVILTADHGEALHERGVYGHLSLGEEFVHGEGRHYLYDELLHVPLIVRIPDNNHRRNNSPFSLGWLHELLGEIAGVDLGEFPYSSEQESHLSEALSTDTPVVSDTLSESGHTVAVQDSDKKLWKMTHSKAGYEDTGIAFRLMSDGSERIEIDPESVDRQFHKLISEHSSSPNSLRSVEGEISSETDDLLKQLGYKT
ncbi:sulfatase [Halobaculum limi]|uniref:sulfatase n=1 Tax=Halobaculum limi TaxID=3031916 RepID=UPI002404FD90|nr:sulfatase [Halobaculum sp. YSMS11]